MSDTDNGRARFNLLLAPEQKERWEEYADDNPEVDSLSHLVRLAVQKEMTGANPRGNDDTSAEVAQRLSEVIEQSREVTNRLQSVEARLNAIEQAVQDDPALTKLANDVFAVLPTDDQIDRYDDPSENVPPMEVDEIAYTGLVADIAALVDAAELDTRKALDKLETDTARLRTRETHDGETRWFKEV